MLEFLKEHLIFATGGASSPGSGNRWKRRSRERDLLTDRIVEEIRRIHGFTLHPEQVRCGLLMTGPVIAEMATGEGKTAAAVLTATLLAESGWKLLVATANDYLAERDARFAAPVLSRFGHACSFLREETSPEGRRQAYAADVIYAPLREFVFDFLRDRLAESTLAPASVAGCLETGRVFQGQPEALLCDEADSILIDEAVTPFIISDRIQRYDSGFEEGLREAARIASALVENIDFADLPRLGIVLTPSGRRKLDGQPLSHGCRMLTRSQFHHCVELALRASKDFHRDQHYVVQNGDVSIVDEFTGRLSAGRKWSRGVHQAIEAREELPLSAPTEACASMTVHDYLARFPSVSGMTGTAREARAEFRKIYGLRVEEIARHRPLQRVTRPALVFRSAEEKWEAVIRDVQEQQARGRAVLIGTRTVAISEELSQRLCDARLEHVVLNARNADAESAIVSLAGQPRRITVATNMAGRGTDIRLHPSVLQAGGLHVIGTEFHSSRRIDRQLQGRCARQGDPGSFQQFASLEDHLLSSAFGDEGARQRRRGRWNPAAALHLLQKAQRRLEQQAVIARMRLCRRSRQAQEILQSVGLDPILNPFPEDESFG
jgi:preprotein translocase subunit SecA